MEIEVLKTDVLILGAGGAGLFAALHAKKANPDLDVTIASKGLLGKSGCTRMVQGGYNVALGPGDSVERHFMDTIEGGKWLPRQDIAWTLIETAVERVQELENELGCFFDRNPDGNLHFKAFAGQTYDRTVHKSDLTGIEIIGRLMEQVWALDINRLEEHRAVELVPAKDGSGIAGVLMIDVRTGGYRFVQAKTVMLGTGGGPSMYRYHTPSGDKTCDGLDMALRYGLKLRDMEMVQFHPTGLLGGPDTRMTGTVLEEGLRGAGGWLVNGNGERFMERYDPKLERATRDIVSRSIYAEMREGRTTPQGGIYIHMEHMGPEKVEKMFPGMVKRCADCGFSLPRNEVEIVPTAHYLMGGVEFECDASTASPGLFAAGEDCGGAHGANRLGGNGVANSTVFGGIAGDSMAAFIAQDGVLRDPDQAVINQAIARCEKPFSIKSGNCHELREKLSNTMWDKVGILRNEDDLKEATEILKSYQTELEEIGVPNKDRRFNLTWHDRLNMDSLISMSKVIAMASIAREDSRGAHFREDFPETGDLHNTNYTLIHKDGEELKLETPPVEFTHVSPGETLIKD